MIHTVQTFPSVNLSTKARLNKEADIRGWFIIKATTQP